MSFNEKKLDFWIRHNQNVLMSGLHGVGKTTLVLEAFNRAGLKWKYFSASTLDPWTDLIGVPTKFTKDGREYLDFIRPKELEDDDVQALFFDEYNRAPKKVRNAVMELIQFKSINGRAFNNLRIVWAAINPDDNGTLYDVEPLDPAQKDRFQVHVEIPYQVNKSYFTQKFGRDIARAACSWWEELPADQKRLVSPRRLDYAMQTYLNKGDLRDVLPTSSGISKLVVTLKHGPVKDEIEKLFAANDKEAARNYLRDANIYDAAKSHIFADDDRLGFFLPLLNPEQISSQIVADKKVKEFAIANSQIPEIYNVLSDIVKSNSNKKLVTSITKKVSSLATSKKSAPPEQYFSEVGDDVEFFKCISNKWKFKSKTQRLLFYKGLHGSLPKYISERDAIKTLDLIGNLLNYTLPKDVVLACPRIWQMANHCLGNLQALGKTDSDISALPEIQHFFTLAVSHGRVKDCLVHPSTCLVGA